MGGTGTHLCRSCRCYCAAFCLAVSFAGVCRPDDDEVAGWDGGGDVPMMSHASRVARREGFPSRQKGAHRAQTREQCAGRDSPSEADRAARVCLRRALERGIRSRRDPYYLVFGWYCWVRVLVENWYCRRLGHAHRGNELPPDSARLPLRRWRL